MEVIMASIKKTATGGWRAQLYVAGQRESGVFSTKADANAWAIQREAELRKMADTGINTDKTLQDAFDRYHKEVSPTKRGEERTKWEGNRLQAIAGHVIGGIPLGRRILADVTPDILGRWRDMRLKTVANSTINRDFALLSHVFSVAKREWKWIAESPTTDVRRPASPPPRDRRITEEEIERLCLALGYDDKAVESKSEAVAAAMLFAIETAMRAGEICSLTPDSIKGDVAHLPRTKNGTRRDVPLSPRAIQILKQLPKADTCFGLTAASLDAIFRKAKKKAGVDDLTFHDTRHEAITRLARKLNVLELARMVGHRDLKMLQIYYNETAAEIAKKL
jgi:integrase